MLIHCPKCQSTLDLPDDVEGKKVRCPACQEIFRATKEIVTNAIQAGEPATRKDESGASGNTPKNRYETDDDDDLDRRLGELREDPKNVEGEAKQYTRLAGLVTIAAVIFFSFDILVSLLIFQFNAPNQAGKFQGPDAEIVAMTQAFTPVCVVLMYAPMIVFVLLGGRALLSLGSRGLIITGIVFNGIIVLVLGCGTVVSIFSMMTPQGQANLPPLWATVTQLSLGVMSGVLNLFAFILSIYALGREPVARYYRLSSGPGLPPR